MDGVVMKLSLVVIFAVLAYFVWTWWQGREVPSPVAPKIENLNTTQPTVDVPQGPGVIMYGTNDCPWCVKQKDYFAEKKIEYTFKDCNLGECPSFVTGFPTIVKDGKVMPGYQEL